MENTKVKSIIKITLKIIGNLLFLVILVAGIVAGFSYFSGKNFFRFYIVTSGSMEPSIKVGGVVLVVKSQHYLPGDVITFAPTGDINNLVTHRAIFKLYPEGIGKEWIFMTSGDANKVFDNWKIKESQIQGKVVLSIPYVGYASNFIQSPKGFIILIVIPATIIIYEEIRFLLNETGRFLIKLRKKSRSGSEDRNSLKSERKKLPKAFALIPVLGATMIVGFFSASYFFDSEKAGGVLSVADSFLTDSPTPTPTTIPDNTPTPTPAADHVVINEVYYFVCTPADKCGNNPQNEWIELYNQSSNSLDLSGWTLTDNSSSDSIPSGTSISPHGFLIVTPEVHTFDIWSSVPLNERVILGGNIGNGLKDDGDRLILKDNSSSMVDAMSYGNDTSELNPAAIGVIRGHSLERKPAGFDTDAGSDFIDQSNPSPGIGLP